MIHLHHSEKERKGEREMHYILIVLIIYVKTVCVYDGQVKQNISNLLLKMSCITICVKYISKSPSETLMPAVFLSDLSPPSHTHTDSRVHEKCWLARLSLSLHPTTYSLSRSLSASFSCSVYLSSTAQFPEKMVKWSYKNDTI